MHLVGLVLVLLVPLALAQCPYTGLQTWATAGLATTGDVTVAAGTNVQFDVGGTVTMNSITILGTVAFADVPLNLSIAFIKIGATGKLLLGSVTCALTKKIIITLTGPRTLTDPIGTEGGALGAKGIVGFGGATVEIFGTPPNVIWTRLSATANQSDTTITVQDSVNWVAGQKVLITGTDYASVGQQETWFPDDNEVRVIKSVSGKTITLTAALNNTHWGIWPENAEVAVLDRNIVIQGDSGPEDPTGVGFGGHIMVRDNSSNARFDSIELTRMGQSGVLGRYPVHFHVMTDKVGQNNFVKRSSIHDCYQRCVTVHDTNGITVDSNVGFNTIGHMFFLEDASERFNVFNKNLGVKVNPNMWPFGVAPYGRVIPSDNEPTIFWITNPQNTWTNNVAVGNSTHGYWFSLPERPIGISAGKYANSDILPRLYPLIQFENNTAHSLGGNGFHCDDGQDPDGTIVATIHWSPSTGPYNLTTNGYVVPATFNNFRAYKARGFGAWMRGSNTIWNNFVSINNGRGMDMVPGPHLVTNGYFEGESANIGMVRGTSWNPVNGRSRPIWYSSKVPICGYEHYDASGPVFLDTIIFKNFVTDSTRAAGAHCMQRNTKNIHQPSFRLRALSYDNANVWWLERFPNNYTASPEQDNVRGAILLDTDGSSYGVSPSAFAVSPEPIITYGLGCDFKAEWNMSVCPAFREGMGLFSITNNDPSNTDFKGTNTVADDSDPYWFRAYWYGLGDYNGDRKLPHVGMDISSATRTLYRMNGPMRRGYTIRFANDHPTPPKVTLGLEVGAVGDWVIIALPYPTGLTYTIKRGWSGAPTTVTAAASMAELGPLTYFYDNASKHLYVKVYVLPGDSDLQLPFGSAYAAYSSYQTQYYITTSCSKSSCLGPNLVIPAPVPLAEDAYIAALQACQVVPANTYSGSGEGVAYFSLDPALKLFTYNIYHNLGATVTGGGIYRAAAGATGSLVFTFENFLTPMRGSMYLPRDIWIALANGELYVQLTTSVYTGGLLRGQIGCDTAPHGACSYPPPTTSIVAQCTPLGNTKPIFADGLAVDRDNWSWGVNGLLLNDTTPAAIACGTMGISFNGAGAFASGPAWNAAPFTLDPSQYGFLQFLIRNPDWPTVDLPMYVSFTNTSDAPSATVDVSANPSYVDNLYITDQWTRVKIPLSAFGVTSPYPFKTLTIRPYWNIIRRFYMDEVRFIQGVTEGTTAPIAASSIVDYSCVCGNCPDTSPPIPTSAPAPPPAGSSPTAAAGPATSSSSSSSSGSSGNNSKASKKNNTPMIAGIVVAVIVVAVAVAGGLFYFLYWRPHHSISSSAAFE